MTERTLKAVAKLAGVTSFTGGEADYIAPPAKEIRDQANASNEELGFISDKPRHTPNAPAPSAPATAPLKKRTKQPSQYPDHYNLRLRDGDRERFDDYAYRHRIPKGEAFRIMLGLAEAEEKRLSETEVSQRHDAGSLKN